MGFNSAFKGLICVSITAWWGVALLDGAQLTDTFQKALGLGIRVCTTSLEMMSCHFKPCSVAKDRLSMWRVHERRRAFVFIGYPVACSVAGPKGTRFRLMGLLERMRRQE